MLCGEKKKRSDIVVMCISGCQTDSTIVNLVIVSIAVVSLSTGWRCELYYEVNMYEGGYLVCQWLVTWVRNYYHMCTT